MKMKKIKLKISGIKCPSCALNIDGELEETEGVRYANTSYARSETEVEFDPDKISEKKLIAIIKKTGYKATLQ